MERAAIAPPSPAPPSRHDPVARRSRTPARHSACRRYAGPMISPSNQPSRARPSRSMPRTRRRSAATSMPPVWLWPRISSTRRSVFNMPQADSTEAATGTTTRLHAQFGGDGGDVQAGRAAERQHRIAARIDAAAHRGDPHAVRHAGVHQAMDAAGRLRQGQAQAGPPAAAPPRRPRRDPTRGGRPENSPDRDSPAPDWHPSPSPRCRPGRSRPDPDPRRRSPAPPPAAPRHRPCRSIRRPRPASRCPGPAARSARWPPSCRRTGSAARRAPARCRSRCRPCRTRSGPAPRRRATAPPRRPHLRPVRTARFRRPDGSPRPPWRRRHATESPATRRDSRPRPAGRAAGRR